MVSAAPYLVTGKSGPSDSIGSVAMLRETADMLLDRVAVDIQEGVSPDVPLFVLNTGLQVARSYMPPPAWRDFCTRAQRHPLINLLKQDPFIARVNEKPRGYAGDATMIDLIYRTGSALEHVRDCSALGREIYNVTSVSITSESVRERRQVLARLVDEAAARVDGAAVFAVAAGHLREAELSRAFACGKIGRWVALDQDADSIAEIDRHFGGRIETIPASISVILKDQIAASDFDLIYAAGLYDYLPTKLASRLTQKLTSMLRPGGKLLFANFADDVWDAGFMEAVMDWHLIMRTRNDMRTIAEGVMETGIEVSARHWTGIYGAIHYCEITRS